MKGGREGVRVGGRGCDGGHLEELHPLAVAVGEGAFQGRGQLAGVHVLAESLQGGHHLYLQMKEASQEDQRIRSGDICLRRACQIPTPPPLHPPQGRLALALRVAF